MHAYVNARVYERGHLYAYVPSQECTRIHVNARVYERVHLCVRGHACGVCVFKLLVTVQIVLSVYEVNVSVYISISCCDVCKCSHHTIPRLARVIFVNAV